MSTTVPLPAKKVNSHFTPFAGEAGKRITKNVAIKIKKIGKNQLL